MRASQTLELLDPVVQALDVNAKGLLAHKLPDIIRVIVIVTALGQMVDRDGSALAIPDCTRGESDAHLSRLHSCMVRIGFFLEGILEGVSEFSSPDG